MAKGSFKLDSVHCVATTYGGLRCRIQLCERTYTVSHHDVFRYSKYSENIGAKTAAVVSELSHR